MAWPQPTPGSRRSFKGRAECLQPRRWKKRGRCDRPEPRGCSTSDRKSESPSTMAGADVFVDRSSVPARGQVPGGGGVGALRGSVSCHVMHEALPTESAWGSEAVSRVLKLLVQSVWVLNR